MRQFWFVLLMLSGFTFSLGTLIELVKESSLLDVSAFESGMYYVRVGDSVARFEVK